MVGLDALARFGKSRPGGPGPQNHHSHKESNKKMLGLGALARPGESTPGGSRLQIGSPRIPKENLRFWSTDLAKTHKNLRKTMELSARTLEKQ